MMFSDPSENDPQAAFMATMGLGPTQPYTTDLSRRRGGRQAPPQRQAAQPQMTADAFAPPQPLAQPTEQPESMWGPQGGNVNAMHVNPLPVLREAAGAVGMTFAPLAALGESAYQAIGGTSGQPQPAPQPGAQPSPSLARQTEAGTQLPNGMYVSPEDQVRVRNIQAAQNATPYNPQAAAAAAARDRRVGAQSPSRGAMIGASNAGAGDPDRRVMFGGDAGPGFRSTAQAQAPPAPPRAFAPLPVINGATPPKPGELPQVQSYQDVLRDWRMHQSDWQMRNPNYGGGAGVALNDVLNFNGPGYQRAQEASNDAMLRAFAGMHGVAEGSEKSNQSQQRINMEGHRDIGQLEVSRHQAATGRGQLEVNQRAQQTSEVKAQNDIDAGAQLMRSLHALTMKPGQTPEGLRTDMAALMTEFQRIGRYAPGQFNAGREFSPVGDQTPGGNPSPPGGPGRPPIRVEGNQPRVRMGDALADPRTNPVPPEGTPGGAGGPPVIADPQWERHFGSEGFKTLKEQKMLPERAITLGRIIQNVRDPAQRQELVDQARNYLVSQHGQQAFNEFIQPTSGRQALRFTSNIFSNPPEEQVVASQFRNALGQQASAGERNPLVGGLSTAGISTLLGAGPLAIPIGVGRAIKGYYGR